MAVRGTMVEALHAAAVCRCRHCRVQAGRTVTRAVAMLATEPGAVAP